MFFTFLLVVQFIVAALMVIVILMQKSEGGGLTSGGSPSGLMSARGAADFLTRATAILAAAFIVLSITLAVLAANRHSTRIDSSLQKAAPAAAVPGIPTGPVTGNSTAVFPTTGSPVNTTVPANSTVPFGQ